MSKAEVWHVTFGPHDSYAYDGTNTRDAKRASDADRSRRAIPKRRHTKKRK